MWCSICRHDDSFEPGWKGFRFKSADDEERFVERYMQSMISGCKTWSACHVAVAVLTILSSLQRQSAFPVTWHMAWVPNVVIAVATFCLVSLRYTKPYCLQIVSVAVVLMCCSHSLMTHQHAAIQVDLSLTHRLPKVVAHLSDDHDAEALQQLEEFLVTFWGADMLNAQFMMTFVSLLLLAFLTFSQSTLVAMVLVPVTYALCFCSPYLEPSEVTVRLAAMIAVVVFIGVISINVSKSRRSQFLAERTFERAVEAAVQASRKADSILNHTLKNTMGDAAGEIELFLAAHAPPEHHARHLQQSAASLRKGMRSCRHRQAYLQLVARQYTPTRAPTDLAEFTAELAAGRAMRVALRLRRAAAEIDVTLCALILDNAISNAFKHGHPQAPDVRLTVTDADEPAPDALGPDRRPRSPAARESLPRPSAPAPKAEAVVPLTFTITNRAHLQRPRLTPHYLQEILSGAPAAPTFSAASPMSDRIGLQHSFLAADADGIQLTLTQDGDLVTFRARVLARAAEAPGAAAGAPRAATAAFPRDVCFHCIDDSATARRLLEHNLRAHAQTENVRVFGEYAEDVPQFMAEALEKGGIAILDQNLDYGGNSNLLGTDLVMQLRAKGFRGLICIRSGNVAPEDEAQYYRAGVDCVYGKDLSMKDVVEDIKANYVQRVPPPAPLLGVVTSLSLESLPAEA